MMRSFMTENELPGSSLAVAKDGRLVYARGFGYADVEKQEPVQPDSLFRIASISKPVTSVAISRLIDAGKLTLDDRVFDILNV
jgi:N-acyl-D-amino-acid deacylase